MGASWQAFYAHLCAASIIRAMPETEIPPAMRGDDRLQYEVQHRPKKERQREHRGVKCSYQPTQHGGEHVALHTFYTG